MKIYVIRHGQSVANLRKEMAGWAQVPLSELGHEQARSLSPYLRNIKFDKIYSSDLLRSIQTAQDALGHDMFDRSVKIREISVGSLSGHTRVQCIEQYGDQFINDNRKQDFSAYGGENQLMIGSRVFEFVRDLEKLENVTNVAVFGHEGTVHQMLNYVFDTHLEIRNIRVANASVTLFAYEKGCWKLVTFGFTGEL